MAEYLRQLAVHEASEAAAQSLVNHQQWDQESNREDQQIDSGVIRTPVKDRLTQERERMREFAQNISASKRDAEMHEDTRDFDITRGSTGLKKATTLAEPKQLTSVFDVEGAQDLNQFEQAENNSIHQLIREVGMDPNSTPYDPRPKPITVQGVMFGGSSGSKKSNQLEAYDRNWE